MFTSFWKNLARRPTCHLSFLIFHTLQTSKITWKLIFHRLSNLFASLDIICLFRAFKPYWPHWTNLNWTWFLCPKSLGCLADLVSANGEAPSPPFCCVRWPPARGQLSPLESSLVCARLQFYTARNWTNNRVSYQEPPLPRGQAGWIGKNPFQMKLINCFRNCGCIFISGWEARRREKTNRKPGALFCQLDPRLASTNQRARIRLDQSEVSSRNLSGASWEGPAWPCCTTTSPQETSEGEKDEDGWGGDQHRQHHPAAARGWDVCHRARPLLLLHLMDPQLGSCAVHCNRKWSTDGRKTNSSPQKFYPWTCQVFHYLWNFRQMSILFFWSINMTFWTAGV